LAQVIGNLLNNACRYSGRGSHIVLAARREGSEVVISVRDNGIGIPPEKLDEIFDVFSQVDHSLERATGGLGIGLHLVKRFVELHGGSVRAHSDGLGKGSEFVVRLPIVAETVEAGRPVEPVTDGAAATARRVLIVDDNRDSAKTLALLLKLSGNEAELAHDGEEAVAKAASFEPDVVLLDIGLPKLNGYDACRQIRRQPWGKDIVLVALTGWGQEEDRRKSQEAGFDEHFVKPVDHAALIRLLRDLRPARV
jgi:CheY-like chemotaxis protein